MNVSAFTASPLSLAPPPGPQVCVRDARVSSILFPVLYGLLFAGGLVLNGMAVAVFTHIRTHSTFLVYMKNLLAADLLMVLTLPVRLLSDAGVGGWRLRAVHCRYTGVLFYVSMYISIVIMGLISLDRYLKVVLPFYRGALRRVPVGRALCAVIWATMLSLALPNMVLSNQLPNQEPRGRLKCSSLKSPSGLQWHEGVNYFCQVLFWGTLLLMVVCYSFISKKVYQSYRASHSNSRPQTKAKVFVVVGVFFVCFAPFHFNRVPYTLTQTRSSESRCWVQNILYGVKEATLWLCTTNVCLDPLIYVYLCRTFRIRLLATLHRKPQPPRGMDQSETSTHLQPPTSTHIQPPVNLKDLPQTPSNQQHMKTTTTPDLLFNTHTNINTH
ncbi:P2Y purinoceptor 12-like [Engraulis encrasicolus]|uniref:P2Y purinoceptor 12-like n=1 Tax=Engraulis encrasicolus TaxID=184585 RepID=UPI002FD49D12